MTFMIGAVALWAYCLWGVSVDAWDVYDAVMMVGPGGLVLTVMCLWLQQENQYGCHYPRKGQRGRRVAIVFTAVFVAAGGYAAEVLVKFCLSANAGEDPRVGLEIITLAICLIYLGQRAFAGIRRWGRARRAASSTRAIEKASMRADESGDCPLDVELAPAGETQEEDGAGVWPRRTPPWKWELYQPGKEGEGEEE